MKAFIELVARYNQHSITRAELLKQVTDASYRDSIRFIGDIAVIINQ